jgi:hypothetical protein
VNSAAKQKTPSMRGAHRWGIFCVFFLILAAGIAYWWHNGGREKIILFLQDDFRVTNIDQPNRTMRLTRPGEIVIVSCDGACDFFRVGEKYSMMNRGGVLEFKSRKRRLELPILEQHLEFEKPPGVQG